VKKLFSLLLLTVCWSNAQIKTTGIVNLANNVSATLELNNTNATAKLTLSGPNDRWFALQFGSFTQGQGMRAGSDLVWWNNTTLVDASHNGIGAAPTTDMTNNWTLVSNTDNSPTIGLRTVTFTRPFVTNENADYTFDYNNDTIDFAWARKGTPGYTMTGHGGLANAGYAIDVPFSGTLAADDFSLSSTTTVYPNPAKGSFTVASNTILTEINMYAQSGAFIKKINPNSTTSIISTEGIASGVYFIELKNASEKSWKKIIVD
jgi:Secretion system C-terminal sorting domain